MQQTAIQTNGSHGDTRDTFVAQQVQGGQGAEMRGRTRSSIIAKAKLWDVGRTDDKNTRLKFMSDKQYLDLALGFFLFFSNTLLNAQYSLVCARYSEHLKRVKQFTSA